MKALSIVQPWATLITHGHKAFETRDWSTSYRGSLLIHASKKRAKTIDEMCETEPFKTALAQSGYRNSDDLPRGGIIGIAHMVECFKAESIAHEMTEEEIIYGDFRAGRYAWYLDMAVPLDVPLDYRGSIGIFEVDDEYIKEFAPHLFSSHANKRS